MNMVMQDRNVNICGKKHTVRLCSTHSDRGNRKNTMVNSMRNLIKVVIFYDFSGFFDS